jgi:hypothetical protein
VSDENPSENDGAGEPTRARSLDLPHLDPGRRGTLVAASIGATVAIGAVCAWVLPSEAASWVLIGAIALAASVPIAVRLARGTFDIFEPVVFTSFAFLLLWVARPAYSLTTNYSFFSPDVWSRYPIALLAAFVGIVAFQLAYHSPAPQWIADRLPAASSRSDTSTILGAAIVLTVAAIFSVFLVAHERGGIRDLFANREGGYVDVAPFIRESFLVAVPAAMLFLVVPPGRHARLARVLALIPLGVIALMALPAGDRRYLLPVVIGVTVLFFLRRQTRPRLGLVIGLVVVVLVFVIDPLRSVRTGDDSYAGAVAHNLAHPLRPFTTLLRSGDTSMIEAVAMQTAVMGKVHLEIPPQVPEELHRLTAPDGAVPFRHGKETITNTVLAPIPRQFWPGKPLKVRTLLIDRFYGTTPEGGCVTQCPTFSFIGEAYADFGLWSVVPLTAAFGLGLATGYRYLRRFVDNPLVQAAYASGIWIAFQPWGAGMSIITHAFILTVVPILLVAWTSGRRRPAVVIASREAVSADTHRR